MNDGLRTAQAVDGTVLRYEVAGPAEGLAAAGPSVVFLHGSLARRSAFRKIRATLEPTRTLILTILRGHEDDTEPLPADYGLATTELTDLLAILQCEGESRIDLVAHSTGGSIAIALAARYPQRVRRMVLIEPTLLPLLKGDIAERVSADVSAVAAARAQGDHAEAMRLTLNFVGGSAWKASSSEARQRILDALAPLAPLAGPHIAALADLDVSAAEITAMQPEVLLLYGRESAYFEPSIAACLAELRPDFEQLHIDRAGHNSHLDRPDVVGPVVAAFLQDGGR